jgi:hypothetical protein
MLDLNELREPDFVEADNNLQYLKIIYMNFGIFTMVPTSQHGCWFIEGFRAGLLFTIKL